MHSNGIIQSGLSGKTFRTRAPVRVRMRRIAPGGVGPPPAARTTGGRPAPPPRPPRQARALELPEDPELVRRLRAAVLVEGVVLAVLEGADLVAERPELVGEIHAHETRPLERGRDQPARGP